MPDPQLERERHFHDRWAEQTYVKDLPVREAFEHPAAVENRFILELIGNLKDIRLLDVGSGLGESSIYFASRGAMVTACDVSPGMLKLTEAAAEAHGVHLRTRLLEEGTCDFGESEFDVIYGANVLHHVPNHVEFLNGVKRALVPGGRFFFWDPLGYNPVIWVYRLLASAVRTPDERPLRFTILKTFKRTFEQVDHREFWLFTQILFLKYFVVDRVDPNVERYWKRIYKEDVSSIAWWFLPLSRIDRVLLSLPLVRRLAWNMVCWGHR